MKNDMKFTFTVGIPASGKSTWANDLAMYEGPRVSIINRDEARAKYQGLVTDKPNWSKWKWKWEKSVNAIIDDWIIEDIEDPYVRHAIISDTNLDWNRMESFKDRIKEMAEGKVDKVTFDIKVFWVELDEAWRRDAQRSDGVGQHVIYSMYQKFLDNLSWIVTCMSVDGDDDCDRCKELLEIRQRPRDHLPKAIIVDVDGTLADMNGVRGPFDWKKVGLDAPKRDVIAMVNALKEATGARMIVMSGRDGVAYDDTLKWLIDNKVQFDDFYIRPEGNCEKDTIIKRNLYLNHVHGYYNVINVVDDRPQVCRMWRDLNLDVMQVADPHKEF